MHVALPFVGAAHEVEQSPQCVGSDRRSTQVIAQRVGVEVEHPLTQEYRLPPIESTTSEQRGVGSSQRVEQPPQREGAVTSVSQPSCGLVEQCDRLGRHAPETSQTPATHRTALGTTPVRVVQSLPQRPQL